MKKVLILLGIASLAWFALTKNKTVPTRNLSEEPEALSNNLSESPKTFKCDGRTHCSQMTSCDEATYFLRNCPNTKMDGNNDGVPCEKQWCN